MSNETTTREDFTNIQPGATVLYTRRPAYGVPGGTFPALVVRRCNDAGTIELCAFTPSPEPAWAVQHDTTGAPGTWRRLSAK